MRSLTDLVAAAHTAGLAEVNDTWHRAEIMDALRQKTGSFDPDLQIDPQKACDLKGKITWGSEAPFAGLGEYLNDKWVLEPKLDGARLRLFLGSTGNSMNSGRRSDVTYAYIDRSDNFPHLRDTVVKEFAGTVLDGELMPPCASLTTVTGVTTKGTLNSAMALLNVNPAASVATQEKYGKAIFMVFDILAFQGESTAHLPLSERRVMVEQIVGVLHELEPAFQIVSQFDATEANIQQCLDAGFEGAMLKRRASLYQAGKRSSDWQKVKRMSTGDFFIIGSVPGKGRNEGKVGSMQVAWWKPSEAPHLPTWGNSTVYCADVAGISDAFRDELTDPATGEVKAEWLGRVIEVMGQGKTKNGRIRHPHFVRVRPDKEAVDCTADCSIDLFEEV